MTSPESAPFDLDRIVDALAVHDVRYVVIGGISGLLHGALEHVTRDVDVLVRADRQNRRRLAEALTDLGVVSDHPLDADDFAGNTQWETDAGPVDVLVTATGPDETILVYADIEPGALIVEIAGGRLVPIASLEDIIRMKEAVNRQKDLDALPELRGLRGDSHPERATIIDPFAFDIECGVQKGPDVDGNPLVPSPLGSVAVVAVVAVVGFGAIVVGPFAAACRPTTQQIGCVRVGAFVRSGHWVAAAWRASR